jgi:hypothetical protein
MTSTPSDLRQADLQRLIELFEENPNPTNSTEPLTISHTDEPSRDVRPAVLKRKPPSLRRRAARSLFMFCMGVAATLAWQSYGDATREMIASFYPQLGWLEPQTVGVGTALETRSRITPATPSDSQELLKSILVNLAAVRQSVDQLAAEFGASQQQMASDLAKLKAAGQDNLDKTSSAPRPQSAAAQGRKPVPVPAQSPDEPLR